MSILELKDVWFDYATSEELEQEEEARERREKKRKKPGGPGGEDPFGIQPAEEAAAPLPDAGHKTGVLNGVSLRVESGEFVALVGHNGSGKSTLAKLLNGLLLPVSGEVLVDGRSTRNKKNLFEIRKCVGMVFQNPDNQMIASIVEDDIAFGPENIGVPSEEIRERVDWALRAVGMSEYATATPFKLSGGQKQRIAIAGMLAIRPRVLVLDESTAMLDPRGRDEVMEVVRSLHRDGITVLHITHFMDEAAGADRVLVLDGGVITADGSPSEVFCREDVLAAAGLRLPSVMQAARLLRQRGVDVAQSVFGIEELVDGICRLR